MEKILALIAVTVSMIISTITVGNSDVTTTNSNKTKVTSPSEATSKSITKYKSSDELQEEYVQYTYPNENDRILLCNLVGREYGSDYVPVEEKAKVVSVVMNRVNSEQFPSTIYDVIHQPGQFEDAYTSCWDLSSYVYSYQVTDSVIEAVDYYFSHVNEYDSSLYFYYGDGNWNYFY